MMFGLERVGERTQHIDAHRRRTWFDWAKPVVFIRQKMIGPLNQVGCQRAAANGAVVLPGQRSGIGSMVFVEMRQRDLLNWVRCVGLQHLPLCMPRPRIDQ